MPRTVRDAIKLTRAMGKEYIWIDALCIEQAEDNHPGDWDNEASKVGDYYANAECLISAMRAGESAQGFLTERVTWRYPQRRALLAHGETRCHRQQLYFWAEGPRQSFFREKLSEPLLERGWCLQERILCPRRLHWTKNGLFWECNSALASEQEAFSNYSRFENSTTELGEVAILRDEEPTALVEDWYKITEDYSRMKLSYEKDRFAAIHGLATRLAKRHNDTYYAGIFGSRLAQGLMYQDACDSKKTPDSPICFPTWSWAAASGGVRWSTSLCYPGVVSFVELVEFPAFPQSSVKTDFSNLTSRKLRIKAPLARILPNGKFVETNEGWDNAPPKVRIFKTAKLEVDLDLGPKAELYFKFDRGSTAEPKEGMPIPVFFAAILLQFRYQSLEGIILQKGYKGNMDLYTREGIFKILDDFVSAEKQKFGLWLSELTLV
ncbi:hypothetical protein AU210_016572 [Fusarium oxysporum f. sp. radicis-cucumerinum]|uniref:Heterokaryon incompatibility domain-containing protein n=1 Tax=Fusarium oxysporum f. sp. radicis-cucumerinum TaxID=327505 RepID=A0A2H3FQM5_FUSOX|nr:hypothetical protein AU210_016572 [Fusarium oxysporum f. sp. radicis-cucumerinum]